MQTYYVTEHTYTLASDTIPLEWQHYYLIQTAPACGNLSGDPITDGWCGTTDDWAECAHGEYCTLEEAQEAVRRLIGCDRLHHHACDSETGFPGGWDEHDETLVECYSRQDLTWTTWDTGEWLYGQDAHPDGVTAETTDEELAGLADEAEAIAEMDRVRLDGEGVLDVLTRDRDEQREDAIAD